MVIVKMVRGTFSYVEREFHFSQLHNSNFYTLSQVENVFSLSLLEEKLS